MGDKGKEQVLGQLLPQLTEEEFEALKADIAERGVQVPVEYDEDGNILDGHHRVRACQELGIKDWPRIVRVGLSEEEKIEHILSLNLNRRQLTREQKREIAKQLRERGWSFRRIARVLAVGTETVRRWLAQEETSVPGVSDETPETSVRLVEGADGKLYPARKRRPAIFAATSAEHKRVQQSLETAKEKLPNKVVYPQRALRLAREAKAEKRAQAKNTSTEIDEPGIKIVCVRFQDLEIEEGCADLIFTDPPYTKEFLPQWEDLGAFAARVLKPGKLFIAYCGAMWLPEVINMLSKNLDYLWLGAIVMPGAHSRVFPHHIVQAVKPLLFFSNGPYTAGPWFSDTAFSEGREKNLHPWQQALNVVEYYISTLTEPGQLVIDPCVGTGTTPLICQKLKRNFIGCDIDSAAIQTIKDRLAQEAA